MYARQASVVIVKPGGTGLSVGSPRRIFGEMLYPRAASDYCRSLHRLLAAVPAGESAPTSLTLVTNWSAALPR